MPKERWFPGRWPSGTALVLGPLLYLAGLFLRYRAQEQGEFTRQERAAFAESGFALPEQLALYAEQPELVTHAYAAFAASAVVLLFAYLALARLGVDRAPVLAVLGGACAVLGELARFNRAGVDHTAFQLVDELGLEKTTEVLLAAYVPVSYGPWWVPVTLSALSFLAPFLLAAALFRAGVFGTGRAVLLVIGMLLWSGVLKEAYLQDWLVCGVALCVALVPLGVRMLLGRIPEPREERRLLSW